jgi:hypothetical protein
MLTQVTRFIRENEFSIHIEVEEATPEQSLIIAIIARAIHDAQGLGRVDSYNANWVKSDAEAWLRKRTKPMEPWSYVWCCDQLGISPEWIDSMSLRLSSHPLYPQICPVLDLYVQPPLPPLYRLGDGLRGAVLVLVSSARPLPADTARQECLRG